MKARTPANPPAVASGDPSVAPEGAPNDAIERSARDAIDRPALDATERSALDATERSARDATERGALDVTERSARDATERPAVTTSDRTAIATLGSPALAPTVGAVLTVSDRPPRAALGVTADDWLAGLDGPTLVRVAGRDRTRCRAVVTLLHGNEPSGVRALHAWLASGAVPAVDAVLIVASVAAARRAPGFAHRMLPGARDLNRCFRPPFDGAEGALAAAILAALRAGRPQAIVDLHNNTGHNPAYGVGTVLDHARLAVTGLFAARFVHSTIHLGALTEATADLNAVTIECGRAGDPAADAVALAGLARFLGEPVLALDAPPPDMTVLVDPVRVALRPGVRIAFGELPIAGVDLTLRGDVDRHNFEPLLPGVPVGWLADGAPWPLDARGADGEDVSRDYFVLDGRLLVTRRAMVPIMMTTSVEAALADCLFYAVHQR